MQDQWGREVTLTETEGGFVYALAGYSITLPVRNDARALEQLGMHQPPETDAAFNAGILAQIATVEATRDEQLLAGIEIDGVLYHTDEAFRNDLTDLIMGFDKGLVTGLQTIRAKDNTLHQLSYQQILTLKLLTGQRRQQIFGPAWAAKDALRAQLRGNA